MGHGRSIFWAIVYFMDLSICAKFQGHSSMASYLSQGSQMKMPSEKYVSGAILGHVQYIWTSKLDIPDLVSTYHISTTIVPSFVCIADAVAKFRARQLGRNRHIVAWSAKLLSPNAEIVTRLNSVILADRRLKMHPISGNWV